MTDHLHIITVRIAKSRIDTGEECSGAIFRMEQKDDSMMAAGSMEKEEIAALLNMCMSMIIGQMLDDAQFASSVKTFIESLDEHHE